MLASILGNVGNPKQHTPTLGDHEHLTISPVRHLASQEWSLSRSQTEPLIQTPEKPHPSRLSVDGSPRHPSLDRDICTTPISPTRPQKKHRSATSASITTAKSHSRTNSRLPKSPSVPAFHTKPDPPDLKSPPPVPTLDSFPAVPVTPLLRTPSSASTADSRSLAQRRAPASHSSYGVETSNGPPPSFTTQRTLSQDRLWKPSPQDKTNASQIADTEARQEGSESSPIDANEAPHDQEPTWSQAELHMISTPRMRVDEQVDGEGVDAGPGSAGHSTETLCTSGGQLILGPGMSSADERSKHSGNDDRKSEDLFLNIAHTDAGGQNLRTRSERRQVSSFSFVDRCCNFVPDDPIFVSDSRYLQSRLGTFYVPSVTRSSNDHPGKLTQSVPAPQDRYDDITVSPRTEVTYRPNKRHSFGLRPAAASPRPLDDSVRQRYFSTGTRMLKSGAQSVMVGSDCETPSELQYNSGPRTGKVDSTKSYRRSNLPSIPSDPQERLRYTEHNLTRVEGTDSTMSTTAPSTVGDELWDTLVELKSRIRNLELNGKLPSSSAAAMSTVERPQTATTTVTTLSSTSKHGRASTTPVESVIDGVPVTVHPLLHEALRKARPVLVADLYQKLEATASDALQLASGLGLQCDNASTVGVSSSAKRHLRRRADSMCQGLTELTIELTIALSASPRPPTGSQSFHLSGRDVSSTPGHTPSTTDYRMDSPSRFSRRISVGSNDPRSLSTSRGPARLETGRATLLHNGTVNSPQDYTSPEVAVRTPSSAHSQKQMQPTSSSRQNRAATRVRRRAQATAEGTAEGPSDGADNSENEDSPSVRPVSRTGTKVSLRHRSARDRTSLGREYTSSYPLPSSVRKGSDLTAERSPSVIASAGQPFRRPYGTSNVNGGSSNLNSPSTPKDHIQPSSRRYVTGGFSRESGSYLSSTEHTPDNVTVQRGGGSGSKRSLGLTSRLGLFVNRQLRATKAERGEQESLQEQHRSPTLRITHQPAGDDEVHQAGY